MNVTIENGETYTSVIASYRDSNASFLFEKGQPRSATLTLIDGPFVTVRYYDAFQRERKCIRLYSQCKNCVCNAVVELTPPLQDAFDRVGWKVTQ